MKALLLALALIAPLQSLDDAARRAVQESRRPGWEAVMKAASNSGKPAVALGLLVGIACFDAAQGVPTVRLALATLAITNLAVEGMKRATFRARPDGEHKRSNAAFPSSHAANAFAIAMVLARRWRRLAPVFFVPALVIAYSRMYLDRHWLSDVVAGSLLGIGVAWWVGRAFAGWAAGRGARPAPVAPGQPPG